MRSVTATVYTALTEEEAAFEMACSIMRQCRPLPLSKTPIKQPLSWETSPLKAPDHTPSTSDCGQEHAAMERGVSQ